MPTINEVTGNLFNFYADICSYPGFSKGKLDGVSWVKSDNDAWPEYILGGGKISEQTITRMENAIISGKIPAFWIREESGQTDFEELAWTHGIRKINYWRGMSLEIEDKKFRKHYDCDVEISRINSVSELQNWLEVVNSEIISGKKILPATFRNVLDDNNFDFWQLKQHKKLVSTLLVYRNKGILGIYLLATLSKYRGRGYASCLMAEAMDYYYAKGMARFVLHSTPLGYPLYKNMGFKELCEYSIYWKVGKI